MNDAIFMPIAGAAALADANAQPYDRRWAVVDAQAAWLDAARAPRLGALSLGLRFGYLVMRAPGMLRLDVPLDVIEDDDSVECTVRIGAHTVRAVDEGDLAAAWLAEWLGQPCRLVKIHPDAEPFDWPA